MRLLRRAAGWIAFPRWTSATSLETSSPLRSNKLDQCDVFQALRSQRTSVFKDITHGFFTLLPVPFLSPLPLIPYTSKLSTPCLAQASHAIFQTVALPLRLDLGGLRFSELSRHLLQRFLGRLLECLSCGDVLCQRGLGSAGAFQDLCAFVSLEQSQAGRTCLAAIAPCVLSHCSDSRTRSACVHVSL